ncbi:hypothetical protein BT93_C0484 [Corymbia citriodora subsp. variegata]|nr:hypothetical protein BT93_C0484 [Corymbia citriodora subsp. variegata]
MACLWKQHWSYWRNPAYTAVRLLFTTFIALMFGTIFWNLGSKRRNRQDLFNAMGSMYMAVLFTGFQNSISVQPVVAIERISLLSRESSWSVFCSALCLCTCYHRDPSHHYPNHHLWSDCLCNDRVQMDSQQVLLVHLLYVLHLAMLHFLWDDDRGSHAQPKHSRHNLFFILFDLEPFLRICRASNEDTYLVEMVLLGMSSFLDVVRTSGLTVWRC